MAIIGLALGAPIIALGFASGSDALGRIGAFLELTGAAGLVVHGVGVQRDRGRWTTDAGWHRFAGMSLLSAPVWFLVAVVIATGPILLSGAVPSSWPITGLAAPLVIGWIAQVLVGSWTHLVPAIGPGDPAVHAQQRRRLGQAATPRLLAWNGGLALVVVGGAAGSIPLVVVGAAAIASALAVALGLFLASIARPHGQDRQDPAGHDRHPVGDAPDADRLDDEELEIRQIGNGEDARQPERVRHVQGPPFRAPPPHDRGTQENS